MFRSLLTVVGCLCLILPARADECDRIVENLIALTPGLQLDKRMLAEGVDIVYLKHPHANAIASAHGGGAPSDCPE